MNGIIITLKYEYFNVKICQTVIQFILACLSNFSVLKCTLSPRTLNKTKLVKL